MVWNYSRRKKSLCALVTCSVFIFAGDDEYNFEVWVTTAYTIILYWTVGAAFIIMDITNKPSFFRKYKTQPEAHVPLDKTRFFHATLRCLFNQFVVGIPMTILFFHVGQKFGTPDLRVVPSFTTLMFQIIVMGVVYEFGFYYSHRLSHHRLIYKYVHKIHHEWTAPVSTMAVYAHWLGESWRVEGSLMHQL